MVRVVQCPASAGPASPITLGQCAWLPAAANGLGPSRTGVTRDSSRGSAKVPAGGGRAAYQSRREYRINWGIADIRSMKHCGRGGDANFHVIKGFPVVSRTMP